ncbi:hypothetical protein BJ138DRAFT_1144417 [Hygrophoropsis aurantiaca]|uniref:Uncharacterized protein n=1 Tax=Hygrophoropsis aurantiaca TaxID=72124 RepID=A0ACB8ALI1_9AGAM|nr:hypothetical protein BJ138DRAFT_1144417 [Hygrophoropsis aurantiaca]
MSAAAKQKGKPMFRRLSQVYVEIPHSPLHTAKKSTAKQSASVTSSRKENALLPSDDSHMESTSSTKRKIDCDMPQQSAKKLKTVKSSAGVTDEPVVSSEAYPNGFFYCHQCNKKRDVEIGIRCTVLVVKDRQCGNKYCNPCLKNRYGLSMESIKIQEVPAKTKTRHITGQDYVFKCPRCDDICNCVKCRKAKGLKPTGNLALAARQSGGLSAADVLRNDIEAIGPMTSKSVSARAKVESKSQSKMSTSTSGKAQKNQTSSSAPGRSSTKLLPKSKSTPVIPKLTWSRVNMPLSLDEVEERIHIREFALRFESLLDIPRSQLEELEEIRGSRTRGGEDDDDDLVPWVSEPCLKSLILGLLQILDVDESNEKSLKIAMKRVRDSGGNLNKIWVALSALRINSNDFDASSSSSASLEPGSGLAFPDPLPAPSSATIIRTRSGTGTSLTVVRSAQLVPVVAALIDMAVDSADIRAVLDAGVQESKERAKEAKEAIRMENDRYDQEKEDNRAKEKKDKFASERHKRTLSDIDDALKLSSYAYIPRVCPLGRDADGRVYWALSPGMNEREAAVEILSSGPSGGTSRDRRNRKRLALPPDERSSLKKWSWFVAVWGIRPHEKERIAIDGDDSDEDEDDERWWGFSEPEEIVKLASWISAKSDASVGRDTPSTVDSDCDSDDEQDPNLSNAEQSKALAKELEQYAALLRWRTRREEEE